MPASSFELEPPGLLLRGAGGWGAQRNALGSVARLAKVGGGRAGGWLAGWPGPALAGEGGRAGVRAR